MSELEMFIAMLSRVGIGHGTRDDFNPNGTAVQVEHDMGNDEYVITDWQFDSTGKFLNAYVCE